jgi:hypothetical protein
MRDPTTRDLDRLADLESESPDRGDERGPLCPECPESSGWAL